MDLPTVGDIVRATSVMTESQRRDSLKIVVDRKCGCE